MDIIKKIFSLPTYVCYEGVEFQLVIFINGNNDIRLCYDIYGCSKESKHYEDIKKLGGWKNPFYENYHKAFLFLYTAIEDTEDMDYAIDSCLEFLNKNNLIDDRRT